MLRSVVIRIVLYVLDFRITELITLTGGNMDNRIQYVETSSEIFFEVIIAKFNKIIQGFSFIVVVRYSLRSSKLNLTK